MKKLISVILITCLAIALNGCLNIKAETSAQSALKAESSDIEVEDVTDILLEIPQDAQAMFRSCAQLVSYLAVSTYDIDMQNLSVEDFWLIMSLVTYAEQPDSVGEFGTIDLKDETVRDIAEAFFSEMLLSSDMPAPNDIYSAAYVSAEQLYELQPISISDVEVKLVALEQTDKFGHHFIMKMKLLDSQDRIKKMEWHVSIETWEDEAEHFFPYKFIKAWYVD